MLLEIEGPLERSTQICALKTIYNARAGGSHLPK